MRLWIGLLVALLPGLAAAREIKLATWNFDWLTTRAAGDPALPGDIQPKSPEDLARLRAYGEALAPDVVAVEGVDGAAAAAQIFPPARYAIAMAGDDVVQRVGIVVRQGISFTRHPDLAALDVYPPGAKWHLRRGADVTLDFPGAPLRILAVHLKTGCRFDELKTSQRPACHTLAAQEAVLQDWITARAAAGEAFVVLGDFNRRFDGHDGFLPALERGGASLRDAGAGRASPCWGGESFIDHILLGGPARDWLVPDSLRVLVYREHEPEWKKRLAGHCPVSIRLNIPVRPEAGGGETP